MSRFTTLLSRTAIATTAAFVALAAVATPAAGHDESSIHDHADVFDLFDDDAARTLPDTGSFAPASTSAPAIAPVVGAVATVAPTDVEFDPTATIVGADADRYVTTDGRVVAYDSAVHHGDAGALTLARPITAMAATPTDDGYWLVAGDGGIFAYGDAGFFGSTGDIDLARPIVDLAPTPSGNGYWLVGDDGGVFAFGDARYFGSMGAVALNDLIVGIEATPTGDGYWLVARDGGVFAFGDAPFLGSTGFAPPDAPVVDIVVPDSMVGYWLVTETGEIHSFGTAATLPDAERLGQVIAADQHEDGLRIIRQPVRPSVALWQSGGLEQHVLDATVSAVAELGGASSVNHTGTVRMLAVHRNGRVVQEATPGWQIPFTARAVDPDDVATFLGADVAASLADGDVVLAATTARLRGARPGDILSFAGWDDRITHRRIGAVVPDGRTSSSEVLFSIDDARSFGFDRPSSIWITGVDDLTALDARLDQITQLDDWVRYSRSWDPSGVDGVPSTMRLKSLVGEFEYRFNGDVQITMEPSWIEANIVRHTFPIVGAMWCNRHAVPGIHAALAEIEASGLAGAIDVSDTRRNGGCWNPRRIRGSSGGAVSRHAWGLAFDINPATNAWGTEPTLDPRVVEIFRSHGFAWGGTWTRPDGMHFEWRG